MKMTERIRKLREQSLNAENRISAERALLITEFYQSGMADAEPVPVQRALAFKYILEHKYICVNEGELIVGERGPAPKATPTYPEICIHSLQDLEILNDRPKVSFKSDETTRAAYRDIIIPYWKGKSNRDRIFQNLPQEWKEAYTAGVFTEFQEQRAPGHTALGIKMFRTGLLDLKEEIAESLAKTDLVNDPEGVDKRDELRAMDIVCDAMIRYAERYAERLEELAAEEKDPVRKKELEKMAAICRRVPAHAPTTVHEALQHYWFIHLGVVTELNPWDSFNPGRLDQSLYPLYKKQLEEGTVTQEEVYEMVFDLMFSLNATEDQLDFPVIYGSAKNNWMSTDWKTPTENLVPLLDAIIEHIPAPKQLEGTPQMLITSLDYSAYTGRIAVGRVHRGTLKEGMNITLAKRDGSLIKSKIKELHTFEGLGRKKTNAVSSGDICAVVGVEGFEIGDTICDFENPEPLPPIAIDEPTMSMLFTINDSPFFGKEGKFVTSRHIQDRLTKELDKNLALRVRKSELEDGKWIVSGRGVLHLSVLIETMRREGYELQVGQPQVIFKEIDGVKCEPIEELTISVPEEYSSKMIDMVTRRKGDLVSMETQGDRVNIEFDMPSRGIIGLRTNVLTASAGEAIMAHRFKCYQPYKGEIERRSNGSMIAMESGTAFAYAIDKLQDRGKFFIYPQDEVYAGQVVGEHVHENDLVINVTKSKKLTNMRASGSDDKARIIPPVVFSLEEALEYIKEDEYVEVTPKSMRMRKVILDETERKRANKS